MGFLDDLFTRTNPDYLLKKLALEKEQQDNARLLSAQRAAPRLLADDQMRAQPVPQYQSVPQFSLPTPNFQTVPQVDPNSGAMMQGNAPPDAAPTPNINPAMLPRSPAPDAAPRLGMDDATRARYETDRAGGALAQWQMQQALAADANKIRDVAPGNSLVKNGKQIYQAPFKPEEAKTEIGKLVDDLNSGRISQDQFKVGMQGITLKTDETQASIAEKKAQAGMTTTRAGLMTDSGIAPETVQLRAQMWAAGDQDGAFKGIPNSIYGSPARKAIADMGAQLAQSGGGTGADQVARGAALSGDKAGMRTAATAGAKMDTLATEVEKFADQAEQASDRVPRGSFVPLTQAEQAIQAGTSSPELAAFVAANTSLVNAYSAVAGRGTPTVAGQEHAYKMLSTATSPAAYRAVVKQLRAETAAAKVSPNVTMEDIRKRITSGGGGGVTMPAVANPSATGGGLPPGWTVTKH